MQPIIIDVREPKEYQSAHAPGAINIPPAELMSGAKELADMPKDAHLILYCRTGSRSAVAERILTQLGFTNITNGINADHIRKHYL